MNTPKAAAALTGGLLARKGLARPAMRRAITTGLGPRAVPSMDDLGWNDMGDDAPVAEPVMPSILPPSPVAQHIATIQETLAPQPVEEAAAEPVVVSAPVPAVAPAPVAAPAAIKGGRSAFTLRIDAERHLRLRLLSAVQNQSAQTLLIGALDALLAQHPNIDLLAADPKTRDGMNDTGME